MRIVVADPDVSFSEPFRLFLQARGHEATTASDGLSCLNARRDDEPDVLAISSNLLWGGSEGVLSVMQKDRKLCNMPVLLMQAEGCDSGLRRHPMVISTARRPLGFDDLASRLKFLAILGEDETCHGKGKETSFVESAKLDLERAVWNA
jgi:DNA-binding response OmpR family regulator